VPRKNKAIVRRLMKKGFDARMSKHIKLVANLLCAMGNPCTDSRVTTVVAKYQLLSRMAEQLNLSRQQFLDLIDCRLDEAGLIAVYKEMHFL